MNLIITITGKFLDDEDPDAIKEDLEEELRAYWNGSGISVEVERV